MIKYESSNQQRDVTEFISAILIPLKSYVKPENREHIDVALRVLANTDIEEKKE